MSAVLRLTVALVLASTLTSAASAAGSTGDAGSSTADFLRIGVGGAAVAQGEAYAARSGVIEGLHYNPAGIALMRRPEVQFQHNEYLLDIQGEYIGAVIPRDHWTFGVSLSYLDHGKFTRRTLANPQGLGTFGASAISVGLAGAYQVTPNLSVGAIVRPWQETLDALSRNGVAGTIGLHYRFAERGPELGLVLRNLGNKVHFDRIEEQLPLEAAFGVSMPFSRDRVRVSGELAKVRDQELDWKGGLELRPIPSLALRAGYDSRNDLGKGYSFGGGYTHNSMTLDYAIVPFDLAGEAHRASLTVAFGDSKARETAVDHVALLSLPSHLPLYRRFEPPSQIKEEGPAYFSPMRYSMNAVDYIEGPESEKWVADAAGSLVEAGIALAELAAGDTAIEYGGVCGVKGDLVYLEVEVRDGGGVVAHYKDERRLANVAELWSSLSDSLKVQLRRAG